MGTWRSRTYGQVSCSTRPPDQPTEPLPAIFIDSGPHDCVCAFDILHMRRNGLRRVAGLLTQAQATGGPEAVGRCFTGLKDE
jgi:hypothetical protein